MSGPTRPVVRYYGGKWSLAPWIHSFFPKAHVVYAEPFGGAASVLLRKSPSKVEVYNDLDGDMVNLFRVLRDKEDSRDLHWLCDRTPYSVEELRNAYLPTDDRVERARRTLIRGLMGHGSSGASGRQTGLRRPAGAFFSPGDDWANWRWQMDRFTARLTSVLIESEPASVLIKRYDAPTTLFYVDPPYPMSTRGAGTGDAANVYRHDMKDDGSHREMAGVLRAVQGMVIISGYPCELYDDDLFAGWDRVERTHRAEAQTASTEVVWMNPACSKALHAERDQSEIFGTPTRTLMSCGHYANTITRDTLVPMCADCNTIETFAEDVA